MRWRYILVRISDATVGSCLVFSGIARVSMPFVTARARLHLCSLLSYYITACCHLSGADVVGTASGFGDFAPRCVRCFLIGLRCGPLAPCLSVFLVKSMGLLCWFGFLVFFLCRFFWRWGVPFSAYAWRLLRPFVTALACVHFCVLPIVLRLVLRASGDVRSGLRWPFRHLLAVLCGAMAW